VEFVHALRKGGGRKNNAKTPGELSLEKPLEDGTKKRSQKIRKNSPKNREKKNSSGCRLLSKRGTPSGKKGERSVGSKP